MKRIFDMLVAVCGLIVTFPILLAVIVIIWSQDFRMPFYIAPRVGLGGGLFRMVKLRSMVVNADRSGVNSTSVTDNRITPIGYFVRKYKLDELTQLWNVLLGDMSVVGPRPNVVSGVAIYTEAERKLLSVRPGITDLASIVFADEGEILRDSPDPDGEYDRLIRPWKSRLGLLYVENCSFWLDAELIGVTALALFSRQTGLRRVQSIVRRLGADAALVAVSGRAVELIPTIPPGIE